MKGGPPGVWIHLNTLCSDDLDVYERATLLALITLGGRKGCVPAQKTIAARAKINIKTCIASLNSLREKRWISWKPRMKNDKMQTTNSYQLEDKVKAWVAYQDGVQYVTRKRVPCSPKLGYRGTSPKNGGRDCSETNKQRKAKLNHKSA